MSSRGDDFPPTARAGSAQATRAARVQEREFTSGSPATGTSAIPETKRPPARGSSRLGEGRPPRAGGEPVRALVGNLGDGTLQIVELREGRLRSIGKVPVGAAPKRVAWVPPAPGPTPWRHPATRASTVRLGPRRPSRARAGGRA
jgi:hypothetical protein